MPNKNSSESESPAKSRATLYIILASVVILVIVGVILFRFCGENWFTKHLIISETIKKNLEQVVKTPAAEASRFAAYQPVTVNVTPQIPEYSVAKDFSNITNFGKFSFSDSAKELLARNAFVVVPSSHLEFFPAYEGGRYAQIPNFVTTDSILHNYHLLFDYALKNLEEEKLSSELQTLNNAMLAAATVQYEALQGTEWENAAKRNLGFFAVGSRLLDPQIAIPTPVKKEVEAELALIMAHEKIAASPVMNMETGADITIDTPQGPQSLGGLKEDYSQYIPRGHYEKSEQLKNYFKSMMWYGRLSFRLKNIDETKSAMLITLALNEEKNRASWDKIFEPISFFVGKSDDITYYQLKEILVKVYGQNISLDSLSADPKKLDDFVAEAQKLAPPQINSMPIFQASIQPDREKEIKGFRFMGQRFTIDAAIFQRLIAREVGPKGESCAKAPFDSGRMLPQGLDILAVMGSEEAYSILKAEGETEYACYSENLSKAKDYIQSLDDGIWTHNLYWGWLYSLLTLTEPKPAGYPSFMHNLAWARKELNTYLGSWTELKHDTILYAKQAYAELGGAGEQEEIDHRGYVEPNPYLYARLAALSKMTKEGLESRSLLGENLKASLERMETLTLALKTISEKELNNQSLSQEEYDLIDSYGGQIEHFWLEVFKDEGVVSRSQLFDQPAAIVADVATDPNGQVLEEGVGNISLIFAVVPVDGKLRLARGAVYSYYEFPWPLSDRLTDTKWRELLNSDLAPKLPSWTSLFTSPN